MSREPQRTGTPGTVAVSPLHFVTTKTADHEREPGLSEVEPMRFDEDDLELLDGDVQDAIHKHDSDMPSYRVCPSVSGLLLTQLSRFRRS